MQKQLLEACLPGECASGLVCDYSPTSPNASLCLLPVKSNCTADGAPATPKLELPPPLHIDLRKACHSL
jgi:hypothetical protein